jgi:phospholipid transport system substrate-binding protein
MKKQIQNLLFILLFGMGSLTNAANMGADVLIKQTSEKVLSTLDKNKKEYEADPGKVEQLIKEIILPLLDFKTMSKKALGKENWKKASDDQQTRFVDAFKGMLIRTYSKSLTEYAGQTIEFLPYKAPANGKKTTLVKTQVKPSNGPAIPIDYRLRIKGDDWLVYDIKIDGISLVTNYRSSFTSDVSKVGMDGLIDKLNKKKVKSSS